MANVPPRRTVLCLWCSASAPAYPYRDRCIRCGTSYNNRLHSLYFINALRGFLALDPIPDAHAGRRRSAQGTP